MKGVNLSHLIRCCHKKQKCYKLVCVNSQILLSLKHVWSLECQFFKLWTYSSCEPWHKIHSKRRLTCVGSMMMILIKVWTPPLERTYQHVNKRYITQMRKTCGVVCILSRSWFFELWIQWHFAMHHMSLSFIVMCTSR